MPSTSVKIAAITEGRPAIALRGKTGSLVWGYRPAAELTSWVIWKEADGWKLKAQIVSAQAFQCRQRPLLFTAPRDKGAPWCWEVQQMEMTEKELRASLGKPLQ